MERQLSYCCSVWGCCSESKLNVLQKIQNRAARVATNSPYDASAAPLIQNLGWLTSNLIRKEAATLTYKSLNSLAPAYMRKLFANYSDVTPAQGSFLDFPAAPSHMFVAQVPPPRAKRSMT